MKTRHKLAIAVVTGAAVGGSIIQGIHAQTTAPTYAVIDISTVTDPEGFKALVPKAGPAVAAFGGKFIVRSENITAGDGIPPRRFVIIRVRQPGEGKGLGCVGGPEGSYCDENEKLDVAAVPCRGHAAIVQALEPPRMAA
jgi:hypothetical protein